MLIEECLGHYSTLTLVFDQGTNTTNLRLTWAGVPVGQEDVTRRNFGEYYVKSIKTTFGYVYTLTSSAISRDSSVSPSSAAAAKKSRKVKKSATSTKKLAEPGWWETMEVMAPPIISVGIAAAAVTWALRNLL